LFINQKDFSPHYWSEKSFAVPSNFLLFLFNGLAGGAYCYFSLRLKDEDFQQIHPMDSHQPPLSERIRICLLFPVIVFDIIKLLKICITLIIIIRLIISPTTNRIMPEINSTWLLSSSTRTDNRIIPDIMYEIVLLNRTLSILIPFIFTISFPPLIGREIFKENNTSF